MNVISSSYGNDSIALIQYAYECGMKNVVVAYCDTGWSAPNWHERVEKGEALARKYGFTVVRIQSMGMEELCRMKMGFPGNAQQFCTAHLKGIPFLTWLDDYDTECRAVVLIGKRRAESRARAETPEFIENSDYHGGRTIWHPLYKHTNEARDVLCKRSGLELLAHRSQECSPCVNANRADFNLLTKEQIERVNSLEVEIGKTMYRPKRFGAMGIYGVMAWAKYGHKNKRVNSEYPDLLADEGCGSPFGCRL
jgi:hypothetical protein